MESNGDSRTTAATSGLLKASSLRIVAAPRETPYKIHDFTLPQVLQTRLRSDAACEQTKCLLTNIRARLIETSNNRNNALSEAVFVSTDLPPVLTTLISRYSQAHYKDLEDAPYPAACKD